MKQQASKLFGAVVLMGILAAAAAAHDLFIKMDSYHLPAGSAVDVPIINGTIPHEILGVYGSSKVLLRPASEGTGVIAGAAVRAVVESAGVRNILSKSFGNNNQKNLVKAALQGLLDLRSREEVERLRGVRLDG